MRAYHLARYCTAAALLAWLVPAHFGDARVVTRKFEKLAGVSRFELDIVPLSAEAVSVGLSASDLRFLIEANLRRANLPWQQNSNRALPYLLADVRIVCSDDGDRCGFVLALRFDDVVQLRGNTTYAEIWEWTAVGIAARGDVAVAVLAELRDRGMPNFVRDYLRANP